MMRGGISAPWRASLGGVAMVLAALGAGCAVDADGDSEPDVAEAHAELLVVLPPAPGELSAPNAPLHDATLAASVVKSSTMRLQPSSEPEPEPWRPDTAATADSPSPADMGATPGRPDDHK